MHELAITQNILDIALRHASENGATRVRNLHLVIGDLSSIIDDSIEFYWGFVCKDTIADGAKLSFERIHATLICRDCSLEFLMNKQDFFCPDCQSANVFVNKGKEFYLDSIDVESTESTIIDQALSGSSIKEIQ